MIANQWILFNIIVQYTEWFDSLLQIYSIVAHPCRVIPGCIITNNHNKCLLVWIIVLASGRSWQLGTFCTRIILKVGHMEHMGASSSITNKLITESRINFPKSAVYDNQCLQSNLSDKMEIYKLITMLLLFLCITPKYLLSRSEWSIQISLPRIMETEPFIFWNEGWAAPDDFFFCLFQKLTFIVKRRNFIIWNIY